ncbi:MAG: helix-turn-helix domain-containing protein [Bacteroidales bacterium]|jgi:transcriptional regulator with XRE-family HTH domain
MKSMSFGSYLKHIRQQKKIPQRKVAHRLDIDTSTLSKMELGERQITISMIEGLADALGLDYRELQIKFVSEKIMQDFKGQPFLKEALQETLNQLKA